MKTNELYAVAGPMRRTEKDNSNVIIPFWSQIIILLWVIVVICLYIAVILTVYLYSIVKDKEDKEYYEENPNKSNSMILILFV